MMVRPIRRMRSAWMMISSKAAVRPLSLQVPHRYLQAECHPGPDYSLLVGQRLSREHLKPRQQRSAVGHKPTNVAQFGSSVLQTPALGGDPQGLTAERLLV